MNALSNYLASKGYTLSDDHRAILSSKEKPTRVVPLIHQRIISTAGEDAEKFLQGQLSCDLNALNERGSCLGAHCNIKGHMISLFRLFKASSNEFWLRMNHEICDVAVQSLQKYIIFSKAQIKEISEQVSGIGITGTGAQALIEMLFEQVPSEDNGVLRFNNGLVVRVPGDRYEIWMPTEDLITLLSKLPDEVSLGSTHDWLLSEVEAAIPDLRSNTQESFIPQMTNLQALGGVSFTKGCYTGQEIVTRLQHRGVLKKPMYLAEIEAENLPEAGKKVLSASGRTVGEVVYAAPANASGSLFKALAVINKKAVDMGEPLQLSEPNSALRILELPYELDSELFTRKSVDL